MPNLFSGIRNKLAALRHRPWAGQRHRGRGRPLPKTLTPRGWERGKRLGRLRWASGLLPHPVDT